MLMMDQGSELRFWRERVEEEKSGESDFIILFFPFTPSTSQQLAEVNSVYHPLKRGAIFFLLVSLRQVSVSSRYRLNLQSPIGRHVNKRKKNL